MLSLSYKNQYVHVELKPFAGKDECFFHLTEVLKILRIPLPAIIWTGVKQTVYQIQAQRWCYYTKTKSPYLRWRKVNVAPIETVEQLIKISSSPDKLEFAAWFASIASNKHGLIQDLLKTQQAAPTRPNDSAASHLYDLLCQNEGQMIAASIINPTRRIWAA
jgi:hypothetical protein